MAARQEMARRVAVGGSELLRGQGLLTDKEAALVRRAAMGEHLDGTSMDEYVRLRKSPMWDGIERELRHRDPDDGDTHQMRDAQARAVRKTTAMLLSRAWLDGAMDDEAAFNALKEGIDFDGEKNLTGENAGWGMADLAPQILDQRQNLRYDAPPKDLGPVAVSEAEARQWRQDRGTKHNTPSRDADKHAPTEKASADEPKFELKPRDRVEEVSTQFIHDFHKRHPEYAPKKQPEAKPLAPDLVPSSSKPIVQNTAPPQPVADAAPAPAAPSTSS